MSELDKCPACGACIGYIGRLLKFIRFPGHHTCKPRPWLIDRDGRVYPDKGRKIELRAKQ